MHLKITNEYTFHFGDIQLPTEFFTDEKYCDIMPKSQNLEIREMSQRHPLLGHVKHQSLTATYAHKNQSLTAMYKQQSSNCASCVF
jgi:hypothetical protein